MQEDVEKKRKRLLYRASYRGFKEADLLLGGFARAHLAGMSEEALDEFDALLGHPDRELYAWATGASEPPQGVGGPVFEALRAFKLA
ncbi:MAG: succinate dehydrogenase assembly factor 2 [Pseudomonadota bacterium]